MTDEELIRQLWLAIQKLSDRNKRLRTRLMEKKMYEKMMLEKAGATPKYIADIEAKDRAALVV